MSGEDLAGLPHLKPHLTEMQLSMVIGVVCKEMDRLDKKGLVGGSDGVYTWSKRGLGKCLDVLMDARYGTRR